MCLVSVRLLPVSLRTAYVVLAFREKRRQSHPVALASIQALQ